MKASLGYKRPCLNLCSLRGQENEVAVAVEVIVEFVHQKHGPAPLIRGGPHYILMAEIAVCKSRKPRMYVAE